MCGLSATDYPLYYNTIEAFLALAQACAAQPHLATPCNKELPNSIRPLFYIH